MNRLASLFIAISLSLALFHELRIMGFGRIEDGNSFASYMFTSGTFDLANRPPNWSSRAVACTLSGFWYDLWGQPSSADSNDHVKSAHRILFNDSQYKHCDMVASFHALFYFVACLCLIIFLENPLIPMLGIFASILGCSPIWFAPYLMPWDLPTMAIWTAIFLCYLWLKKRPQLREQWMILAFGITIGGLFKETVLVTALFLLSAPWSWVRRILTLIGIIVLSQVLNWMFCGARPDWTFSVHEGGSAGTDKWNPLMLWPVLFANAGSLLLLPWALWRRWQTDRDWPLVLVCGAFVGLQALNDLACGIYIENRDWLEIAPLSWVLVAQTLPQISPVKTPPLTPG